MEYYWSVSQKYFIGIRSFLKSNVTVPKRSVTIAKKLEYYIPFICTQCTLLCCTHCSTAPFLRSTPLDSTKQTNTIVYLFEKLIAMSFFV